MDLIYCSVAFAGFSGLFASRFMKAVMELLSFLFLIYLGIKYLVTASLPATTPTMEAVEHKLHPHTAFWIGFVRVLGNPAVLLFWITVSATFISHDWIEDTLLSKTVCVFGTFVGGLLWFILLAFLVAKGHGKFSTARAGANGAHFRSDPFDRRGRDRLSPREHARPAPLGLPFGSPAGIRGSLKAEQSPLLGSFPYAADCLSRRDAVLKKHDA